LYQRNGVDCQDTSPGSSSSGGGSGSSVSSSDNPKIGLIASVLTLGLNVIYIPWGLSINLTAPFIDPFLGEEINPEITMLTFSWSFGDYAKVPL